MRALPLLHPPTPQTQLPDRTAACSGNHVEAEEGPGPQAGPWPLMHCWPSASWPAPRCEPPGVHGRASKGWARNAGDRTAQHSAGQRHESQRAHRTTRQRPRGGPRPAIEEAASSAGASGFDFLIGKVASCLPGPLLRGCRSGSATLPSEQCGNWTRPTRPTAMTAGPGPAPPWSHVLVVLVGSSSPAPAQPGPQEGPLGTAALHLALTP